MGVWIGLGVAAIYFAIGEILRRKDLLGEGYDDFGNPYKYSEESFLDSGVVADFLWILLLPLNLIACRGRRNED